MKKQILYTALVGMLSSFVITSCDDYLEVEPNSGFTQSDVFGSVAEMRSALNGTYSRMTESALYGQALCVSFNPNTDVEMATRGTDVPNGNGDDLACYEPTSSWSQLNSTWNAFYQAINWTNDVIEGIEASSLFNASNPGANLEVAQLYGEAKCLRALLYLDAIRIWGDVVFRTNSASASEEFKVGVTDRHEILDFLIGELKAVEPYMSYAADMKEGVERASREFCQGLIGLLAMNRGGYTLRPDEANPLSVGVMRRPDDYMAYYDLAIEYFGKVISEKKHDLKLSFAQLWEDECNWTTAKDDDILFSIPMLKGISGTFASRVGVAIDAGEGDTTSEYGRANQNLNLSVLYFYSFDFDDLRRDVTCSAVKYDVNLKQILVVKDAEIAKFAPAKWSKLKMKTPLGEGSFDGTGINYTWMRFADVLLLYAEALNEKHNGPTKEAKDALKRVRRRAFASEKWEEKVNQYVEKLNDHQSFFQAIMDERAWEFGGESIRKFDLARWNKFGEVVLDTYKTFQNWVNVENGMDVPGIERVPSDIYSCEIPDPDNPKRIILDIPFFDSEGKITERNPDPSKYQGTKWGYVSTWYPEDKETGLKDFHGNLKYSFRGFVNPANEKAVKPTDPVRYLCPYPSKVITDHRGVIKNYYGYK